MTDASEVTFDAKPKKKPAKKAKRRAAAPRDTRPSAPFPGLTRTACATACNRDGCTISGTSICGHPTKGSQINYSDPAALKRLQSARDQIDVRLDPDRFK